MCRESLPEIRDGPGCLLRGAGLVGRASWRFRTGQEVLLEVRDGLGAHPEIRDGY